MYAEPPALSIAYPQPRNPRLRSRKNNSPESPPSSPRASKRLKRETAPKVGPGLEDLFATTEPSSMSWSYRFRPKPTTVHPNVCIDLYRSALDSSETFVYAVDPRTWVAEVYDPITQEKGRGVDAWVILQGNFDDHSGSMRFTCCKWCPDKLLYRSECLHELVLNGTDRPEFLPRSGYGESFNS